MEKLMDHEFKALLKSRCVGLTGGVATGKSTVAEILRQEGYRVIDADQIARDVVNPGEPAYLDIIKRFGPEVLRPDKTLDRDKLRGIIIADNDARKALEAITHPAIQQKFRDMVMSKGFLSDKKPFFYEAALLFETGRDGSFKEIWATDCPHNIQVSRLKLRSGLSDEEATKIISTQMPTSLKAQKATRAIDTNCSFDELKIRVISQLKTLR